MGRGLSGREGQGVALAVGLTCHPEDGAQANGMFGRNPVPLNPVQRSSGPNTSRGLALPFWSTWCTLAFKPSLLLEGRSSGAAGSCNPGADWDRSQPCAPCGTYSEKSPGRGWDGPGPVSPPKLTCVWPGSALEAVGLGVGGAWEVG